ncbi:MAG TPA: FAD-binding protein, partial [Alphaproteobacteria bacterium]|nr:FAD-binding protein [Alphaproteobacteria bacterium]
MNRRKLLTMAGALPLATALSLRGGGAVSPSRRVRPGDRDWPSATDWDGLRRAVGRRLIKVESPLTACLGEPEGAACRAAIRNLRNPFVVRDNPGATQTSGWLDAWMSAPSVYAVAAQDAADVAVAVNFAREHNLRLAVKGGGHSYQGTSNATDSLLIWTRPMDAITLHDAFVGEGCAGSQAPLPAVSLGAGVIWLLAYDAVTTKAGRYVQGGGCATVGVAGLVQSGGFGSFSKRFGTAAASLLEAEVVTADGAVRIANACTNPELFFSLKGGGGGSFGVVTRLTLRTHDLPQVFGGVSMAVKSTSDEAYRRLIGRFVSFY